MQLSKYFENVKVFLSEFEVKYFFYNGKFNSLMIQVFYADKIIFSQFKFTFIVFSWFHKLNESFLDLSKCLL